MPMNLRAQQSRSSDDKGKRDEYMNVRPECRLLVACARTRLSEDSQDEIRKLVSHGLDWDYLFQIGKDHGLTPLLYYHLCQINLDHQVPQSIMDQLHDIYYGNLARNILLYEELSWVLSSLEEKGIGVVVVKGLALAEPVYRNVALRPMADVDLLVQKGNLPETKETLFKLGFEILPQEKRITIEYMNEVHLVKHQENIKHLPSLIINIHWDLTAPLRFKGTTKTNIQQIISRAQPVKIASSKILVLTPEDQILQVIYHATFQHPFIGLLQLCDVAELIRLKEIELDWQYLVKTSKSGRIATAAYYLLYLARELLGTPVPKSVLKALAPNLVKRDLLKLLLVNTGFLAKCPTRSIASRYLLQTLMVDRMVDTLSLLWKAAFPSLEWLAAYYGHPTSKKLHISHLINLHAIFLAGMRDILKVLAKK